MIVTPCQLVWQDSDLEGLATQQARCSCTDRVITSFILCSNMHVLQPCSFCYFNGPHRRVITEQQRIHPPCPWETTKLIHQSRHSREPALHRGLIASVTHSEATLYSEHMRLQYLFLQQTHVCHTYIACISFRKDLQPPGLLAQQTS